MSASSIRDSSPAPSGRDKIAWAAANMPVLREIGRHLAEEGVFKGRRIALSIHLEAKTADLAARDLNPARRCMPTPSPPRKEFLG